MTNGKRRGRPPGTTKKKMKNTNVSFDVNPVKMDDLEFNENLFIPMKTQSKIDEFFSSDGGVMPGVNYVCAGDPGVGKTTVLLDILAEVQKSGKKCLFISGEMNSIDMVGYVKRYPKFGQLDILFMGDYVDVNPDIVLRRALESGYDLVLVDSMAEVSDVYVDFFGGTTKANTNKMLQLFEEHNMGRNKNKINSSFLIIQQVTKSGAFVGSNKLKHMTTGMMHLKLDDMGRYLHFSKNRRGGNMNKLFFSLMNKGKVEYLNEEPLNAE